MSDEYLVESEVGVQNDGEPVAVVEEPTNLEEAIEEAAETEEPKKESGSKRAKRKIKLLEAQLEAMQRLIPQQPQKEEKPVQMGEPRAEDFDSHEAWVKASIRYEAKKLLEEERIEGQSKARQNSWNEKAAEARSKYDDFDEVLQYAAAPSQQVAEALAESPLGADVAYYLATHQKEYQRINSLSPIAAAREIGLIEAALAPRKESPKTQTTKAPKPVAPVSAPNAPKVTNDGLVVY